MAAKRAFALALAATLLVPGASAAAAKQKPPALKYQCQHVEKMPEGEVWATVWATADRKVQTQVVLWIPGSPQNRVVGMTVRWEAIAPSGFDWSKGLVFFDRLYGTDLDGRRKTPPGMSLELRANPNPPWQGEGAIAGKQKLQFGARLTADWSDVSAMGAGGKPLYLVVRSRKQVFETLEIAPTALAPPFARIEEALKAANTELADHYADPERCDDLENMDILV